MVEPFAVTKQDRFETCFKDCKITSLEMGIACQSPMFEKNSGKLAKIEGKNEIQQRMLDIYIYILCKCIYLANEKFHI